MSGFQRALPEATEATLDLGVPSEPESGAQLLFDAGLFGV